MSKEETKGVKEKFSEAKAKKDAIKKYYNDIAMKNDAINKLKDAEMASSEYEAIYVRLGDGTTRL